MQELSILKIQQQRQREQDELSFWRESYLTILREDTKSPTCAATLADKALKEYRQRRIDLRFEHIMMRHREEENKED